MGRCRAPAAGGGSCYLLLAYFLGFTQPSAGAVVERA
jgi:hypothetical protein